MSKHRVVAAIDFGTHGSGFAWAVVNEANRDMTQREIFYFDEWDQQQVVYLKNLSALLLDRTGNLIDWGYAAARRYYVEGIADGRRYHVNYKMSLQQNMGSAGTLAGSSGGAGELTADEVARLAALCIAKVYEKGIEHITRSGVYTAGDVRWCLTVPAIWDEYTRDLMFKAAVRAGLPDDPDRLVLVPEPEAAALYCIVKGEDVLRASGRRFMVVDAGGGTVDITSYQVQGDRKLAELGAPNGDKAGSNYLNSYFVEDVLCDRLGVGFVQWLRENHPRELYDLIGGWENAKRTVAAVETRDVNIPLTAEAYLYVTQNSAAHQRIRDVQDGVETAIVISAAEIQGLFEKVVTRIIDRVGEQLDRMRAASGREGGEVAVLVGGFAESPYLQTRLTEYLEPEGVGLHIPPRPSAAVVAGATHFAFDPSVIRARRSPLTYGTSAMMPFREGIDPHAKRELNDERKPYCADRFDVFVERDEAVDTDSCVSHMTVPFRNTQTNVGLLFFATRLLTPEYVTDAGVDRVGELTVSLAGSMHLPRDKREVEVRMYFGEARIRAVAKHMQTGKEQQVEISWKPTW